MKNLLAVLFLLFATPSLACEFPESLLTEAIAEEPDRVVDVLEDQRLQEFLSNLMASGYMAGSLPYVERVYVISAKMKPGFDTPHVWLFFVQDKCILSKIPSMRQVIEDALPPKAQGEVQ